MKYLIRSGKVEFSGSKKDLLKYIQEAYGDDYFIQENWSKLSKDYNLLVYCMENQGLILTSHRPGKKKDKKRRT